MIRFVEMKGIYLDDTKSFGFYDTVVDKFLSLNGSQAFDNIKEFKDMYTPDCGYRFERLQSLIPKSWNDL